MFAAGLLDPAGGLTSVVSRIQQPVDQITAQMLRDPGLGMQLLAQMTVLLHGSAEALLQQVVGVLMPQMPGKLDSDQLLQNKNPGLLQVAQHARGVHLQPGRQLAGLVYGTGYQTAQLRQAVPLGMPQTQAALVLLGHGRQQGGNQPGSPGAG